MIDEEEKYESSNKRADLYYTTNFIHSKNQSISDITFSVIS